MSADRPLECARVRVLLEPYVDGDLTAADPALAAAVREHLAGCTDCRRQHDQAMSVPFRLRALTSPAPRASLVGEVMRAIAPQRRIERRAWTLLAPEALLAALILWYMSGLEGLSSLASSIVGDLQRLAGWGSGTGSLPSVPRSDVLLLVALIALTAIAAYHLSLLVQLAPTTTRRTVRE
jgi:predicted anti-sigma-YlaC factor YlaD